MLCETSRIYEKKQLNEDTCSVSKFENRTLDIYYLNSNQSDIDPKMMGEKGGRKGHRALRLEISLRS